MSFTKIGSQLELAHRLKLANPCCRGWNHKNKWIMVCAFPFLCPSLFQTEKSKTYTQWDHPQMPALGQMQISEKPRLGAYLCLWPHSDHSAPKPGACFRRNQYILGLFFWTWSYPWFAFACHVSQGDLSAIIYVNTAVFSPHQSRGDICDPQWGCNDDFI